MIYKYENEKLKYYKKRLNELNKLNFFYNDSNIRFYF